MRGITASFFKTFGCATLVIGAISTSSAQSTMSPATDWTGNYSFSSTADRNLRLLQADMIEKREKGYYESLGKTTINQTVTNNSITKIGQNTNAIGSVNNTTTNIDLSGNNNSIDISSSSNSNGCQDGSVNIGHSGTTSATSGCR